MPIIVAMISRIAVVNRHGCLVYFGTFLTTYSTNASYDKRIFRL